MMSNIFETMTVGQEVFYLTRHNNILKRKKIFFTDDDGIEWMRYTVPIWTFKVTRFVLSGVAKLVVDGEICKEDSDVDTEEYHFKRDSGSYHVETTYGGAGILDDDDWFLDEAEAHALKAKLDEEQEKLAKS